MKDKFDLIIWGQKDKDWVKYKSTVKSEKGQISNIASWPQNSSSNVNSDMSIWYFLLGLALFEPKSFYLSLRYALSLLTIWLNWFSNSSIENSLESWNCLKFGIPWLKWPAALCYSLLSNFCYCRYKSLCLFR